MRLEDLNRLEEKYMFKYPTLYKRLCLDGMLYCDEYATNRQAEDNLKYSDSPSLLLFGFDVELMCANDIDAQVELCRGSSCNNKACALIPLAHSAAGDRYCFFTDELGEDGEMPVVFVRHESSEAYYYAKNLQDFIFRNMLEAVVYCIKEREDLVNIKNMLSTHLRYLTVKQQQVLLDVYNRPLSIFNRTGSDGLCKGEYMALLKREDLEKLLKEEMDSDKLNQALNVLL